MYILYFIYNNNNTEVLCNKKCLKYISQKLWSKYVFHGSAWPIICYFYVTSEGMMLLFTNSDPTILQMRQFIQGSFLTSFSTF